MVEHYGFDGSCLMTEFGEIKLHNKPFEEMELTELYAEKMARKWHRYKMINARNKVSMKKHWLEENKPILTIEEIKQKYENGEMTQNQYKTAFANRKTAISYRMRINDYMDYADRIVFHEDTTIAYLDELIAQAQAFADKPNSRGGKKGYDPRKRESRYNHNSKLDARRKWATREEQKPFPKLQKARARWKSYKAQDNPTLNTMKRMQPIITWDIDTLMSVARDRGYFTEIAVIATIAEALNISVQGAKMMLTVGKLSWSQCIIIGAVFEMTPKEFCDVFLHGYFKEVADGVFKAQVDDIESLLDAPYKALPRKDNKNEVDNNS